MAADVKQRYRGISGDGKGRRISYIVRNTATEQTAMFAVEAVAPLTYATFPRENMSVTEVKKSSVDSTGFPDLATNDGIYYVDVGPAFGPAASKAIRFYNPATRETKNFGVVEKPVPPGPNFSVGPSGRWVLFTQVDRSESDLMLLENFR